MPMDEVAQTDPVCCLGTQAPGWSATARLHSVSRSDECTCSAAPRRTYNLAGLAPNVDAGPARTLESNRDE